MQDRACRPQPCPWPAALEAWPEWPRLLQARPLRRPLMAACVNAQVACAAMTVAAVRAARATRPGMQSRGHVHVRALVRRPRAAATTAAAACCGECEAGQTCSAAGTLRVRARAATIGAAATTAAAAAAATAAGQRVQRRTALRVRARLRRPRLRRRRLRRHRAATCAAGRAVQRRRADASARRAAHGRECGDDGCGGRCGECETARLRRARACACARPTARAAAAATTAAAARAATAVSSGTAPRKAAARGCSAATTRGCPSRPHGAGQAPLGVPGSFGSTATAGVAPGRW